MPDPLREAFRRAVAFESAMREAAAERAEELPWGRALFNDTFHRVYDLNALHVERAAPGLTPETLIADAERLHTGAGHAHRRIAVGDPELGPALAPGFRAAGWQVRRFLYMAQLREPDGPAPAPVRELDEAEHWAAKREFMEGLAEGYDEDVIRQLLERDRLKEASVNFRRLGVDAGGRVVSVCELYWLGTTAQVEDVSTTEEHRGRGYARSTVLTAAAAARDAGCDFVFLVADEDDWPKELYVKLGFDPLGTLYDFLKLPPGSTA